MRHRADKNQQEIVDALRELGVSVIVLSQVGRGCPDLMIGWRGKNYLLEVKSENGELRPGQVEFFDTWKGRAFIVRSVEETLELLECL
jgi:Holliday junction resolvase